MKPKKIQFTEAQINHLLTVLEVNEREGWYFGNRIHYWKRHNALETLLNEALTTEAETCPKTQKN